MCKEEFYMMKRNKRVFVLSLLFCLIQAMIFTMLLAVFVAEATETEEE